MGAAWTPEAKKYPVSSISPSVRFAIFSVEPTESSTSPL